MSVEPSMEEILSSIKRIIAEEGDGPARGRRLSRPAPAPHDDDAEVLELSEPAPDFAPRAPEPALIEPAPVEAAEPPAPLRPEPTPVAQPAPAAPEPIVSASTAEASRGSLDSLSKLVVKSDHAGDGALEGLVRDMLRPMLRDWLDARLPALVETMVADEIARITGQPR